MSHGSAGVTFLSLAYLAEIAVVINLAYRELKFPELHTKLHERVGNILKLAEQKEINPKEIKYEEFNELKSLIDKDGEGDKAIWGDHLRRYRWFFSKLIRTRRSLRIVNFNIILTILILIFCTIATGYFPEIQDVYALDSAEKWVWLALLVISILATIIPLLFIKAATLCEKYLLGFDNKSGIVGEKAGRMFKTKEEEVINNARIAEEFKVSQEKDESADDKGDPANK